MNHADGATVAPAMVEFYETWLYFHLVQAGAAVAAIERAQSWSDYEDARRTREKSLARASHHYRRLIDMVGPAIDPLLAQMALYEGLTP